MSIGLQNTFKVVQEWYLTPRTHPHDLNHWYKDNLNESLEATHQVFFTSKRNMLKEKPVVIIIAMGFFLHLWVDVENRFLRPWLCITDVAVVHPNLKALSFKGVIRAARNDVVLPAKSTISLKRRSSKLL